MIYFGDNLRILRKKQNLTLAKIADINGMKGPAWNNYELGTSYPKFEDLIKIVKYFDISLDVLIFSNLAEEKESSRKNVVNSTDMSDALKTIIEAKDRIIHLQDDKILRLETELEKRIKKADTVEDKNRGRKKYA